MLVPPHHQGVIRRMHLGRGAVDTCHGKRLARELCHEHHHGRVRGDLLGSFAMSTIMAASGESRLGRSCF